MNPKGTGLVLKLGLTGKGLAGETARPTSSEMIFCHAYHNPSVSYAGQQLAISILRHIGELHNLPHQKPLLKF
jgi:hypothetical protein